MKSIEFSPALEADARLRKLADQASFVLDDAIGPPSSRVAAHWDLGVDGSGRRLLQLSLEDPYGSAQRWFSPSDLAYSDSAWKHLIRFWGDFLQDVSHAQLKRLEAIPLSSEGD